MTLAASWALVGLAVLPLVWWWHRRRRRPPTVDLPSLLFVQPEIEAVPARRQAFDPELWVALLAVLLLTLAAAGPVVPVHGEGRRVRAVVSGGVSASARGYRGRVGRVLATIEEVLGPQDRLEVVEEPPAGSGLESRPLAGDLLVAAQAGEAAWRVVISDADAPVETADVSWVSVGAQDAFNVGIVATALTPTSAGFEAFVNVRGDELRAASVRLAVRDAEAVLADVPLEIPAGGHASQVFPVGRVGLAFSIELTGPDGSAWRDDLAADDRVAYERAPLRIHVDRALPARHRQAVEDALVASLGRAGTVGVSRDASLLVRAATSEAELPSSAWRLVLHPAPEAGAVRAPAGTDHTRPDPLVDDLSTAGVDLVYAPQALDVPDGFAALLGREAGGRRWPVVARRGRTVLFLPDPVRGRPAPAHAALWPLFLDDLVREIAGRSGGAGAGYRRSGALDDASTRLGRTPTALAVPDLAGRPANLEAGSRSLRPFLGAAGLLALLLLWTVPWSGRRGQRRSRSVACAVPSGS